MILWTVALQAPLCIGFSRQEYWSGLPCPPPGDLPNPVIKPKSLTSPALAGGFFTNSATWETLLMAQRRVKMVGNGSSETLKRVEKFKKSGEGLAMPLLEWSCKESDTTERQTHTHTHTHTLSEKGWGAKR